MRGTIKKEGNSWYYMVYVGVNPITQKKQYKKKRGFRLKSEAEAACAELIAKLKTGNALEDEKINVSDYLDYWLKTYVKVNCAYRTYQRYNLSCNDVKKYLGTIKLSRLNPLLIETFYQDVLRDKNISTNTLLKTHRTLHLALRHAVQWKLITSNPSDFVNKPKEVKAEIKYWSPELIKENLSKLKGHRLYDIAFISAHTGLRIGELCGLKWCDLDLENNVLKVERQLQRDEEGLELKTTKTPKGIRHVTLYPSTIEHLNNMRNTTKVVNLNDYKKHVHDDDFIFAWKDDGRPMDPHYVSQNFKSALEYCGIEDQITFHGLRHTHATALLKANVNTKTISTRLGHANTAFTMDTYQHVNLDMQKEEVSKAQSLF